MSVGGEIWQASGESTALGTVVTLFEGSSFSLSDPEGDFHAHRPQGLFHRDTRVLSDWQLTINGQAPQGLGVMTYGADHAVFLSRVAPSAQESETRLLIERNRRLFQGMHETITVTNLSADPVPVHVQLQAAADFADVFAVKEGRPTRSHATSISALAGTLTIGGEHVAVRIETADALAHTSGLTHEITLGPHQSWSTVVTVTPLPVPRSSARAPMRELCMEIPPIEDSALDAIAQQCVVDLNGLQLRDPNQPEWVTVAAGAPWFMTLFGRDSLLTSLMTLPFCSELGQGTAHMLAARQGSTVDAASEEQPGRILHETRVGREAPLILGGRQAYYGTADATPLFVMLVGELARSGVAVPALRALLPAVDAAMSWIRDFGDRDGDGFVEYERLSAQGLAHQGWKDSWNGITWADGRPVEGPIALVEVQAYVVAAHRARANIADALGDPTTAENHRSVAADLLDRLDRAFWLEDRGFYAVALDGSKAPVDALTSNIGHILWAEAAHPERAEQVARHLTSQEMFSGWGVRTLASSMGAYNPLSYHNGSVWPHDTALSVVGLTRYGFHDEARRIGSALLDAAAHSGGRLPELFAGLSRADYTTPIPYPTACSPQAWASAAPLAVLHALQKVNV